MDYEKIKRLVKRYLFPNLHQNHLEDCVQYVAMKSIGVEDPFVRSLVIDYLREAGITSKRAKYSNKCYRESLHLEFDIGKSETPNDLVGVLEEYLITVNDNKVMRDQCLKLFERRDWKAFKNALFKLFYHNGHGKNSTERSIEGLEGYKLCERIRSVLDV